MIIREMTERDRVAVVEMMGVFYASDAVHTNGSYEIFFADVDACISDSPYAAGYVFEIGTETIGYAMLAKSFSTEFGKPCIWIEDLYFEKEHRGKGYGKKFFEFLDKEYKNVIFRLEVEKENFSAVALYEKCGFEYMPYSEMKKDN